MIWIQRRSGDCMLPTFVRPFELTLFPANNTHSTAMDAQIEQPMAQALVICDQIIEEAGTHKKSLIGIFNSIFASTFPIQYSKMCVYASLTNGRGRVKMELRGVHVADEDSDDKEFLS